MIYIYDNYRIVHDVNKSLLDTILGYTNLVYPYLYAIVGSTLNFVMVTAFLTRPKKSFQTYTIGIGCVAFQINLMAFCLANIKLNSSNQTLINSSIYACKTLTFVVHTSSAFLTERCFAYFLFVIRCYISNDEKRLKQFFSHGIPILALLLVAVYSLDLIFLDLNPLKAINETLFDINVSCSIGNVNALLIRDSLDFCVYFVIPFVTLYYNAYRLRPLLSYYPIMKGLVQIVFVVTFLPNSLVVFLGNMTMVESLWIDIVFTVTLIVNNSFFLLVTTMHAYFKRHTRHMLFIKKVKN